MSSFDPAYSETVDYLYRLQFHGIRPGLGTTLRLLSLLGDPHRAFRSLHIAGTNGKGSTAVVAAQILRAAGLRTGLYTSPHLIDFTERIRIDGEPVAAERIVEWTDRLRSLLPSDLSVTFFEFTTALAFGIFAESGCEVVVAEAGLGGRFDATNVLTPLASVITNVDYDHEEFLGESLFKIASEKAGIIKRGVPVVTAADLPAVREVIEQSAAKKDAPLLLFGRDFSAFGAPPGPVTFQGREIYDLITPLAGDHQTKNIACAVAAIETIAQRGISISGKAIRSGVASACWEGRLEKVRDSPEVLLDGAHNPAGARALADYLKRVIGPGRKLILVAGIMRDKRIEQILAPLLPLSDTLIAARPQIPRAAEPDRIVQAAESLGKRALSASGVAEALALAESLARPADLICVTGSLYTVGEARAHYLGMTVSPLRG